MVQGIEKFKEKFSNYSGQYVFIGGTACDIILNEYGIPFRNTKDLDIVLIIEALNEEFISEFISFIESAEYKHINKGTGENQFYRFEKPKNSQYPYMIELFSRRPDYLQQLEQRLAPIHVSDDVISLSAILLDDNYYKLLRDGSIEINGISLLDLEYIILFKIKAWIDLSNRKNSGEQVDSKNIKKHKNDVLRLAVNIEPDKKIQVPQIILNDINQFLEAIKDEPVNLKNLHIQGIKYEDIIEILSTCYISDEQ